MPEGQKAGQKGRQLDVGAQRAPRLLVNKYFDPSNIISTCRGEESLVEIGEVMLRLASLVTLMEDRSSLGIGSSSVLSGDSLPA